eukprot:11610383-Karenia_brevis.AAC.1
MVVFDLLSHQEKVKKYLGEAVCKGLLQMEIQEEKKEQLINFGLPFYWVIGNEVMSKILPLGEGKKGQGDSDNGSSRVCSSQRRPDQEGPWNFDLVDMQALSPPVG